MNLGRSRPTHMHKKWKMSQRVMYKESQKGTAVQLHMWSNTFIKEKQHALADPIRLRSRTAF